VHEVGGVGVEEHGVQQGGITRSMMRGSGVPGWLDPSQLPPADLAVALHASRRIEAPRHERLLRGGDDMTVALLQGTALARAGSLSGASTILSLLAPGSSWGLAEALGSRQSSADVEAIEDCIALVTPGHVVRRLTRDRPPVAQACMRYLASDHARLLEESARFSHTTTSERVVHRLVQLAEGWGRHDGRHTKITLGLTQEDLASWARVSRESVAKVLQELRSDGLIRTARREITILDAARLREHAARPSVVIDIRDEVGLSGRESERS
jgi:CRP/FNR family transcriptional regulator, cyclic AMP receptor protein